MRITIIIGLLLGVYMFSQFEGGFVSWFLFYAFLPIALYSIAHYFLAFRGLSWRRGVDNHKCEAGDDVHVKVHVLNRTRFPYLYLQLKDFIPGELQSRIVREKNTVFPLMKKECFFQYELKQVPRGYYRWKYGMLRTGDLFGLVRKEKIWSQPVQLMVFPKIQDIQHWPSLKGQHTGMHAARSSAKAEEASMVMGARGYAPGDRLSRIHWKASASSGQLKSKEFEKQVSQEVALFLNCEAAAYEWNKHPLFENAVSLVASLAYFAMKQQYSCGFVAYADRQKINMPVRNDTMHFQRMLEYLAVIEANAQHPYARMVRDEAVQLPFGTTLVLVTPRLNQQLLQCLDFLRNQKAKVELFWVRESVDLTSRQSADLQFLTRRRVVVHIVDSDVFDIVLARGGAHVSA